MDDDEISESDRLGMEAHKLVSGIARGMGILFANLERQMHDDHKAELTQIITDIRLFGDRLRAETEQFRAGFNEQAADEELSGDLGLEPHDPIAQEVAAETAPPSPEEIAATRPQDAPGQATGDSGPDVPEIPPNGSGDAEIDPGVDLGETPPPLNVVDMVEWDGTAFLIVPAPDWLTAALMVGAGPGGVALAEDRFEVYRPDAEIQVGHPGELVALLSDGTLTVAAKKEPTAEEPAPAT